MWFYSPFWSHLLTEECQSVQEHCALHHCCQGCPKQEEPLQFVFAVAVLPVILLQLLLCHLLRRRKPEDRRQKESHNSFRIIKTREH